MKSKTIKLGVAGVDSGQLLICDPCYIEPGFADQDIDSQPIPEGEFSYRGICQLTLSGGNLGGQLNYPMGHPGAGVAFLSGFGDGLYEVFAEIIENPDFGERVKRVWIELIPEEE